MQETCAWRSVKYLSTFFILILIPVYLHYYGPFNFLWLSDIGLFLTVIGLWTHRPIFISMATVGVIITELAWNVDYFYELLTGTTIIRLSDYMFDSAYPVLLRGISLFHVATPIIWICYLARYGYDRRAFWYMTLLYWIVLLVTYLYTEPSQNIDWVFLPQVYCCLPEFVARAWVVILFVGFPLLLFAPTHYVCTKLFGPPTPRLRRAGRPS